jgi:two-component sensor histidine kinase
VLAPERATALALVLCELAANAIEHGGGHGRVELRRDGAFVEMTVSDHGQGPPPPPGTPGQGLSIARALVEVDLGGTLRFEQEDGVRATVRFPFVR